MDNDFHKSSYRYTVIKFLFCFLLLFVFSGNLFADYTLSTTYTYSYSCPRTECTTSTHCATIGDYLTCQSSRSCKTVQTICSETTTAHFTVVGEDRAAIEVLIDDIKRNFPAADSLTVTITQQDSDSEDKVQNTQNDQYDLTTVEDNARLTQEIHKFINSAKEEEENSKELGDPVNSSLGSFISRVMDIDYHGPLWNTVISRHYSSGGI